MAVVLISHTAEFSMMIEVLIYPALAILALLFLYITLGPREALVRSVTHDLSINIDKCASEHCVRCTKYKSVIRRAREKYGSRPSLRERAGGRLDRALAGLSPDRRYQPADPQQPNILHVSELEARPVWPDEEFVSDAALLEAGAEDILSEFELAYNQRWPTGWLVNNTPQGEWAVFHLINQGARVSGNCAACPKTVEVLQTLVSSMRENVFANASFSVVQPGTDISPHYGPTNVRIRCHLGLRVPNAERSFMKVNGQRLAWRKGKCLFFDDSFLHQVSHNDDGGAARAVLLVDFWHPSLTDHEKTTIDELFKFEKTEPSVQTFPIRVETEL